MILEGFHEGGKRQPAEPYRQRFPVPEVILPQGGDSKSRPPTDEDEEINSFPVQRTGSPERFFLDSTSRPFRRDSDPPYKVGGFT